MALKKYIMLRKGRSQRSSFQTVSKSCQCLRLSRPCVSVRTVVPLGYSINSNVLGALWLLEVRISISRGLPPCFCVVSLRLTHHFYLHATAVAGVMAASYTCELLELGARKYVGRAECPSLHSSCARLAGYRTPTYKSGRVPRVCTSRPVLGR